MKVKYKLVFLRKNNNVLYVVKIKTFKEIKDIVKLDNEKSYQILINNPNYLFRNIYYYFIDIDSGNSLSFKEIEAKIEPKSLDTIFEPRFLKNLVGSVNSENKKIDWFSLIIGLIIGGLALSLIVFFIMQGKIDEIYKTFSSNSGINPIPF